MSRRNIALVWRKERLWIIEELADEVASGLLTGEQYIAMSTTAGRQRLLARVLRQDGWTAYRRMGRLCNLFTELAFKKRELRLMGEEPATAREIDRLRLAIAREGSAVTVSLTGPSDPSSADIQVTRRIREAGETLGITLLDHVIFGSRTAPKGYYSFREAGLL